MLSKRELIELKALAKAHDAEPEVACEYLARIMTSRVSDPETLADMTEFVREILCRVTLKHSAATDTAATQVCWGIMGALSAVGDRIIEEAPDGD